MNTNAASDSREDPTRLRIHKAALVGQVASLNGMHSHPPCKPRFCLKTHRCRLSPKGWKKNWATDGNEFSCNSGPNKVTCSDIIDACIPARTTVSRVRLESNVNLPLLVRGTIIIEWFCPLLPEERRALNRTGEKNLRVANSVWQIGYFGSTAPSREM